MINRNLRYFIVLIGLGLSMTLWGEPHQEGHTSHDEQDESAHQHESSPHASGSVTLSEAQIKMAGITVKTLNFQAAPVIVSAPGEVMYNRYKTVAVTPRVSAQLIQRHVVLGERVKKNQRIATLSSVEMAEAQGDLLTRYQEWKRVQQLGKKIVAKRRYIEAQIQWELAKARVLAYGMTEAQIRHLVRSQDFSQANGRFELLSGITGTVIAENFFVGQRLTPGQEVNVITDESSPWVIAHLVPDQVVGIEVGNKAQVIWNGQVFPAEVAQISHSLDEVTRTLQVRLNVQNQHDLLHAGLFVDTRITTSKQSKEQFMMVPESALLRSPDGDWQLFVMKDKGRFEPKEVKVIDIRSGQALLKDIEAGAQVVIQGAFFLQSERAKSGFEIHNH